MFRVQKRAKAVLTVFKNRAESSILAMIRQGKLITLSTFLKLDLISEHTLQNKAEHKILAIKAAYKGEIGGTGDLLASWMPL